MKNINEMDSHVNQNESSNQVSGKVRRSFRRFIRVAIVLLLLVGGAFFYVRYNANLADSLMRLSGRHVELKYNEYLGALPWRGYSNFIVEEILSVK